jgi:D-amino-acid oxidase
MAHDDAAFAISGHYLLVEKTPLIDTILFEMIDDENYVAVVPRENDIWLGGNAVIESTDTQMKPELIHLIHERCLRLAPNLKDLSILKKGIGFRSGRTAIRVEKEQRSEPPYQIIHNYGQGGSAFSLSWGCAEEVKILLASNN